MLKFIGIVYCFSMVLADIGLTLGQSNQYLPPNAGPPGYDYPKPPAPSPPRPQPPSPGFKPPAQDDHVHEPGMPFDFTYAVNDIDTSNDYNHKATSDGDVTRGEYRVQLPDGRTQIVRYTADWKNGYNAEVSYEGEAKYPEQPPAQKFNGYKY